MEKLCKCICGKDPKFIPAILIGSYGAPASIKCTCSREVTGVLHYISRPHSTEDEDLDYSEELSNSNAIKRWNAMIQMECRQKGVVLDD